MVKSVLWVGALVVPVFGGMWFSSDSPPVVRVTRFSSSGHSRGLLLSSSSSSDSPTAVGVTRFSPSGHSRGLLLSSSSSSSGEKSISGKNSVRWAYALRPLGQDQVEFTPTLPFKPNAVPNLRLSPTRIKNTQKQKPITLVRTF